ncbi:histidine kinase [Bacillus coahuilensis p1.1.43]|uniref:Circadian input-output histidine kinase CikA n=1 Tax=Bacillus coahuilensis p1.1.43 TaxID=1150625 RepID=A0A147KBU8_9BACI|nr:ATP-binding protein [Bacillus coahuilensis]KUP08831.1 histidine kinase [Bacillus coahuilensis p1.1.43]
MGFKKKLYMGLGFTISFLFILILVVFIMMSSIRGDMLAIMEDRYFKVNAATDLRQELYQKDRNLIQSFATEELEVEEGSIDIDNAETIDQIIMLESRVEQDESKAYMAKIKNGFEQYMEMEQEIIRLETNGASELEMLEVYNSQLDNRTMLFQTIEEFKLFQEGLMDDTLTQINETYETLMFILIIASSLALILIISSMLWAIRSTVHSINSITQVIKDIDYNNLSSIPRIKVVTNDEIGEISSAYNGMAASIESLTKKEADYTEAIKEQNWIESNSADIVKLYSRHTSVTSLAEQFLSKITPILDGNLGAFYIKDEEGAFTSFKKIATYAEVEDIPGIEHIQIGQGLIGQSIKECNALFLTDIPADYRFISTGLGSVQPKSILIAPVVVKEECIAVIEIASLKVMEESKRKLVESVLETLGIGITNILGRMEVERLLIESQAQTEELQTQSEELQTQSEELQSQTEELRMMNDQLEERSRDAELKSEELRAAKENLEEKARELQESSQYKSEFLANMSHELRTPLNSILLLSEMLGDDEGAPLSSEQKEFAHVIHSSGQDLLNLINDILDLSKVEAGKLEVHFEEVYLPEFMARLESTFEQIAKKKGIEFNIEIDENIPPIFYTDEQRLQQIMKNLLSNAFKFTEKGSVELKVKNVKSLDVIDDSPTNWVEITVKDTGIGIPKSKQSMIFEAFQQVDGATMRKYGGTGLGLSITKEFTNLLGGQCQVESAEGKGSTFTVYIPNLPNGIVPNLDFYHEEDHDEVAVSIEESVIEEVQMVPEDKVQVEGDPSNILYGKTVILADDDHRNIFTLKNVLAKEGMKVISAENGVECIQKLNHEEKVDLILMDIMMPIMDGYEAIKRIRSLDQKSETPIIALTAKAMKGDRDKCLEAGANDYISKPMKMDQLLSVMRVWLS